jgi:4a-hydroxytetrahydrobiopterin dehydratase
MAENLAIEDCVACQGDEPQIDDAEIERLVEQLSGWRVITREDEKRLVRVFSFPDFSRALEFTNRIGALAEEQDHHPSILTEWGRVTLTWWTHKIHGLHHNDFVMASKSDRVYADFAQGE